MVRSKCLSLLSISILWAGACLSFQNAHADPTPPQVMIDIYDPPIPFEAADKFYLAYELYLTNFDKEDISLEAMQINDKATGMALSGFDKDGLRKMMSAPSNPRKDNQTTIIPAGALKLVYLTIPFNSLNDMPKEFLHHLNFLRLKDKVQQDMETLTLFVGKPIQIMIRPPVRGDFWVAANGLSSYSTNRRTHKIANGQNYFPRRYGVDFVQIDLDGKTYEQDGRENSHYYSYGKAVYSVARGTVAAVKDGIPDNLPNSNQLESHSEFSNGNYILLEIGKGIYAFYGNLMPDSIKVKAGDKISEGQEIAKIGNSGDTKEPQLHFHIVDRPSVIAGNGIPYTFTEFWLRPSEVSRNENGRLEVKFKEAPNGLRRYFNQLVLENMVVKFPGERSIENVEEMNDSGSEELSLKQQSFDRSPVSIEENLRR